MGIQIKRIYDAPDKSDGYRVLVDRLWPRGVSKEKAALDEWLKEVAPSNELRTWFGHQPERFDGFKTKYQAELDANPAVKQLKDLIKTHDKVTLLYGAHDPDQNQAKVLLDYIS
jgi:DNA-3-methyladenine glycosylase